LFTATAILTDYLPVLSEQFQRQSRIRPIM